MSKLLSKTTMEPHNRFIVFAPNSPIKYFRKIIWRKKSPCTIHTSIFQDCMLRSLQNRAAARLTHHPFHRICANSENAAVWIIYSTALAALVGELSGILSLLFMKYWRQRKLLPCRTHKTSLLFPSFKLSVWSRCDVVAYHGKGTFL